MLGCELGSAVEGSDAVVVRTAPEEGAVDVDRGARLSVVHDRPLDPRTVGRAEVSLTSGALAHFLEVRFDPVERAIVTRPFRGQPLEPRVRYTLAVDGARDLDGALVEPFTLTFRTGEAFTEPGPVGSTEWAQVAPIFATHCVEGCHDGAGGGLALDLRTLASTRATALGVAADQTGGTTTIGRQGLSGMARIEEAEPSRSYLVYKMLADPHVWGEPMPPEGPLPTADIARVADWILGGAR